MSKYELLHKIQEQEAKIDELFDVAAQHFNDIHSIKQFMLNRIEQFTLSPAQLDLLADYEFIYNQLMNTNYTEFQVVELMMKRKNMPKSKALAYVSEAKELFNATISINKKFSLKRELSLNEKFRLRAIEHGDLKSAAAFSKIIAGIITSIEEEEHRDNIFQGHIFEVKADPAILGITPPGKREIKELLNELKDKFNYNIEEAIIVKDE